jgi:solute carrier family 25 oxoglutarate transporter 11
MGSKSVAINTADVPKAPITTSNVPKVPTNTPNAIKFLIGGVAGMTATLFVHPMDIVKNRMQMSGEGGAAREHKTSFHALAKIFRTEGVRGIYAGLSAGLFRQATYTTARLGIYQSLFERFRQPDGRPPPFFVNLLLGVASGGLGSFIGTPAEVALIRMTLDGRLPPAERRNYAHVFDALLRITREEGVLKLWRGAIPTATRAMIVNAAQMPTYSQAKQALISAGLMKQGFLLHAVSSLIAALVTTAVSLPVDIVKTRYQNMKVIQGKPEYKSIVDVFQRILRQEGILSFWKGFTPYFSRLGPHTILTFIFIEQLNIQYQRRILKNESYTSTL